MRPDDDVAAAADLFDGADALVVAAGAGMGVDSGLPDFRGDAGFWRAYPALAEAGLRFTEVASPRTFAADPRRAWGFYGHRLGLYRTTVPHEGFHLLQRWAAARRWPVTVFTSNVDGQFERAGYRAADVHACHGSIHWLQCTAPCSDALWPADEVVVDVDTAQCRWRGELPRCPRCGDVARPNILMFGDARWIGTRAMQQQARQDLWLEQVRRPLVVELGAGTDIATVRAFGESLVRHHGARLLRINPRAPAVPRGAGIGLAHGALAALRAIDAALTARG